MRAKMQSLSLVSDMQSFKVRVFKMETESFILFYLSLCVFLYDVIVTRFALNEHIACLASGLFPFVDHFSTC